MKKPDDCIKGKKKENSPKTSNKKLRDDQVKRVKSNIQKFQSSRIVK